MWGVVYFYGPDSERRRSLFSEQHAARRKRSVWSRVDRRCRSVWKYCGLPHSKGAGPKRPPIFCPPPLTYTHTVRPRATKFDVVECVGEARVSTCSGTISIPREWSSSIHKFWDLLHAPTSPYDTQQADFAWWSNYGKFSQARPCTQPLANFRDTNADARSVCGTWRSACYAPHPQKVSVQLFINFPQFGR